MQENTHHAQGQELFIKYAYRGRGCKLTVVHMYMDYLSPTEN